MTGEVRIGPRTAMYQSRMPMLLEKLIYLKA